MVTIKLILTSLILSILLTFIYIKLPPFYINSFNFAVVPKLEQNDTNFNYNGFYQNEVSQNITSSLALFAASPDFKQTVANDLNKNILYLMSKTNGIGIISLKLVSLKALDTRETSDVLKARLQETLQQSVPNDLSYNVNTLSSFNHTYSAAISPYKFFTFIFGTLLVAITVFYGLKRYYYESDNK